MSDKDSKEDKIDELCEQVENRHTMMMRCATSLEKRATMCYSV